MTSGLGLEVCEQRQGYKTPDGWIEAVIVPGALSSIFFFTMVLTLRHFCLLVLLEDKFLDMRLENGSVARC